ncbi:CRISPR system precrRNA processing endoribonuclease RAMP protein Cas6 [Desulfoluna butyratoxydans]|uniref:Crispr-associated protein cas6 c-terminal n=1 Tax=Desulfoluna butyratoxydans TaxID=231438 RepID=A0A4U8YIU0_9BACT|nr:CRISPR system precrRNA processing endoribonuclease RAMP protein Cas6 [Desulfoluna butyratoxydans]VFQ43174.1 crispr-associated protein cas6 c-terminal [Desulfoluna butyratoxydans]
MMQLGNYTFRCRLDDDAVLPVYKGSIFRGVFGLALKKTICTLRLEKCDDCLLKWRCLYASVFETPQLSNSYGKSCGTAPHPFIIRPPETRQTHLSAGSSFDFGFTLLGETNHNLPYFVYAFERMGAMGIGRKMGGRRARFTLLEVRCGAHLLYTHGTRELTQCEPAPFALAGSSPDNPLSRLTLSFETPLRLKFNSRLQARLPFHVLVRAMLRRTSSLMAAFGAGEPDLDYKGLVRRAEEVSIAHQALRWSDWKRYSSRQERDMLMGGMVGTVTYEGHLAEFLPLVDFCRNVNLGKQTAFGLGRFDYSLAEVPECAAKDRGAATCELC